VKEEGGGAIGKSLRRAQKSMKHRCKRKGKYREFTYES
jgi:hypothetical protein